MEKLTPEQQKDIKDLLNEFASEIENLKNEEIKNKLNQLKEEVWELDQTNINNFFDELKSELKILKDYAEYKNVVSNLEKKLSKIEKEILQPTKDELSNLQKKVKKINNIENLTLEEIKELADKWRRKHSNQIKWIVEKLASRSDFIWKIAKKALS